eukprot:TRINITY_DN81_c0_g2_i1.p1 TRINITY_DN81_c0_g2~~TRINITY_DN81_c0_g2_i1.p1  ORF type:complete len:2312 (-),score=804.26 TRINITY_DN81_c0_g2_i1:320-7255(-)
MNQRAVFFLLLAIILIVECGKVSSLDGYGLFGSYYDSTDKQTHYGSRVDVGEPWQNNQFIYIHNGHMDDPFRAASDLGINPDKYYIEWSGYLDLPTQGCYKFFTRGQGWGQVYVDDKLIAKSHWNSDKIELSAGSHNFHVKHFYDKDTNTQVDWTRLVLRYERRTSCSSNRKSQGRVPTTWLKPDKNAFSDITLDSFVFGKNMYAILDGSLHTSADVGCQASTNMLRIPYGWDIAEPIDEAIALMTHYPFAAECLVFSDGSSYATNGAFGAKCHTNGQLVKNGSSYAPTSCNQRILISKKASSEEVISVGDVAKTFVFGNDAFGILVQDKDNFQCSTDAIKLPENWEIANHDIVGGIVSKFKFDDSETRLVFSNGDSYDLEGLKKSSDELTHIGDFTAINSCDEPQFVVIHSTDISAAIDATCHFSNLYEDGTEMKMKNSTPETAMLQCMRHCSDRNRPRAQLGADGMCYCNDQLPPTTSLMDNSSCRSSCLADKTYSSKNCASGSNEPHFQMNVDVDVYNVLPAADMTNTYLYKGRIYASLDNAIMRRVGNECQVDPLPLPTDYEISADDQFSHEINDLFGFSTECVIMDGGKSYGKNLNSACAGDDMLKSFVYDGVTYYYPETCDSKILISRLSPFDPAAKCGQCYSTGDPHFRTFDSIRYDFQGLGSHWLVKPDSFATSDLHDFEIYSKHKELRNVATNEIIFMRYKTELVEIRADSKPTFFVNDVEGAIDNDESFTTPGGIVIKRKDITSGKNKGRRSYSIFLPNDISVRVDARFWRQHLLQIYINLPNRFAGQTGGLCGSCDNDKSNDLKCPGVTALPIKSSKKTIYNYFKDCWAYEPHTSPWDPTFDACANVSESLKQKAFDACIALSEDEREGCMIDVCTTGNVDAGEKPIDPIDPVEPVEPACPAATSIDQVTYGGITYGLLSGASVNGNEALCGNVPSAIPEGWTLADDTPAHKAALGCFSWSSDCVVFSNGKSYNKDLTECGNNQLKIENDDYCYSVKSCSKQVLMVKIPETQPQNTEFELDNNVLTGWNTVGDGFTVEDGKAADGMTNAVKLVASTNGAGISQTILSTLYSSPAIDMIHSTDLDLGNDGYLRLKVIITYEDNSQKTVIANAGSSEFWQTIFVDVIPTSETNIVKSIDYIVELKGDAGYVYVSKPRILTYSGISSNLLLSGAFGSNANTDWTFSGDALLDGTKDISSIHGTDALSMGSTGQASQTITLTQTNPIPFTGVYFGVKGMGENVADSDLLNFKIDMMVEVDSDTDKSVIYEQSGLSQSQFASIEKIGVLENPIKYFNVYMSLSSGESNSKAFFDNVYVLPSCRSGASASPLPPFTGGDNAKCPMGYKGDNCDACDSDSLYPCGGHGTCGHDGKCDCEHHEVDGMCTPESNCLFNFWYGSNCEKYCHPMNTCSGHGVCDMFGDCICDLGFNGDKCNKMSDNLVDIDETITKYHVYTDKDFKANGNCEGLMAVGGDCELTAYGIGYGLRHATVPNVGGYTNRNDLVVGGKLTFNGGRVDSMGNVWVENMAESTISMTKNIMPPGKLYSGLGLDFPLHTARLKALNEKLASLPATGSNRWNTDAPTKRMFYGTRDDINVFEISCEDLNAATEYYLTVPNYDENGEKIRPVTIVNVISTSNTCTVTGGLFNGIWNTEEMSSRTIFNFYEIGNVTIQNVEMTGTVLAMQSHVNSISGNIAGHLFADSLEGGGVYIFPLFEGVVPWEVDLSGYWGEEELPNCDTDHSRYNENTGECDCFDNQMWGGDLCNADCRTMCSGHGDCLCIEYDNEGNCLRASETECACWGDWIGNYCQETGCGDHGKPLTKSMPNDPLTCECDQGWEGNRCNIPRPCIHGSWNQAKECECEKGWSGDLCDTPFWIPVTCAHGNIKADGTCECIHGWQGIHCDEVPLDPVPSVDTCYHGTFNATSSECNCDALWDGEYCEWPVCNAGTVVLDYGDVTRERGAYITQSASDPTGLNGEVEVMYGGMRDEWCHVILKVRFYNRFGESKRNFRLSELPSATSTDTLVVEEVEVTNGFQTWVDMGNHSDQKFFGLSVWDGTNWIPVHNAEVEAAPDCVIRPPPADEGGANVRCECLEGYYGTDCTEHCRHTCGMRGTICMDDGTLYDECQCDEHYSGATCEDLAVNEFDVYIPVVLGIEEYKLKIEGDNSQQQVSTTTSTSHCTNNAVCVPLQFNVDPISSSSSSGGRRLGEDVTVSPIATFSLELPSDLSKKLPSDTKVSMVAADGSKTGVCTEVTYDRDTNVLSGGVCNSGEYSFSVYSDLLDVNDGAMTTAFSLAIAFIALSCVLLF